MEAISLKKVTAIVSICTFGAFMVNAESSKNEVAEVMKTAEVKQVVNAPITFKALIEKFDKDANGLLSVAELTTSQSDKLLKVFTQMDSNGDSGVSEKEYNQYIATLTAAS